jgi:hypothetical protein
MTPTLPWLRLYDEVLDNPKVQRLSDNMFRHWIGLLCLANRGNPRGRIPHNLHDIAYSLRLSPSKTRRVLDELVEKGLLVYEQNSEHIMPRNWDERQKKSDSSAERVARHRAKDEGSNVTEPLHVTGVKRDCNGVEKSREEKIRGEEKRVTPPTPLPGGATETPPPRVITEAERTFNQFWSLYPRGRGSKKLAAEEWKKMSRDDRLMCLERLPLFTACHDWQKEGGKFVKHAERWLKYRGWEDDIPVYVPPHNGKHGTTASELLRLADAVEARERGVL